MGGTCTTHGRVKNCKQNSRSETPKERDHLEDLGVGGRILGLMLQK
jgi:hypothetical protein